MAMLIGDGTDVGDFPIDIDPWEGLFFTVYLFIDGAFDDILRKSGAGEG